VTLSRRAQRNVRRFADHQSDRIRDAATPSFFNATVSSISAGAAADGNALVAVTYRGAEITVAGYSANYTPGVGHRVACRTVDHQVQIDYRIIGYP
jgi:hypothetical protein